MAYEIENLNESHTEAILALWNIDCDQVYPHMPIEKPDPSGVFGPLGKPVGKATVQGAFLRGRLVAAMKWERRATDAPVGELGNLLPGDGLISWLFFDDEAGAEELFAQARPILGKRIYAFPEANGLGNYTVFGTGMVSVGRKRITGFLERREFTIPVGKEWGPQERIGYRLAIGEACSIPPLPTGYQTHFQQEGPWTTLVLRTEDGAVVGTARTSPTRLAGQEVPNAVCLNWLGVEESLRGQGLGTILLQMQIERARQNGKTEMYLTTHSGKPAWKVYEKAGFKEIDRLRSYVLDQHAV
jgi:hypothetical protein